jgi:hypothetical protein
VLYDKKDRRFCHLHHVITFVGGTRHPISEHERNALICPEKLHKGGSLQPLHIPNFQPFAMKYRVVSIAIPSLKKKSRKIERINKPNLPTPICRRRCPCVGHHRAERNYHVHRMPLCGHARACRPRISSLHGAASIGSRNCSIRSTTPIRRIALTSPARAQTSRRDSRRAIHPGEPGRPCRLHR